MQKEFNGASLLHAQCVGQWVQQTGPWLFIKTSEDGCSLWMHVSLESCLRRMLKQWLTTQQVRFRLTCAVGLPFSWLPAAQPLLSLSSQVGVPHLIISCTSHA